MTDKKQTWLIKFAAMNDAFIDIIDEGFEFGESPVLEQLKELIENLNDKSFATNSDNVVIQTISKKLIYILDKHSKVKI